MKLSLLLVQPFIFPSALVDSRGNLLASDKTSTPCISRGICEMWMRPSGDSCFLSISFGLGFLSGLEAFAHDARERSGTLIAIAQDSVGDCSISDSVAKESSESTSEVAAHDAFRSWLKFDSWIPVVHGCTQARPSEILVAVYVFEPV